MLGAFINRLAAGVLPCAAQYRILVFGGVLVLIMAFRPEGLWPSRQRRAELHEGTGGMGALGRRSGRARHAASEEVTR